MCTYTHTHTHILKFNHTPKYPICLPSMPLHSFLKKIPILNFVINVACRKPTLTFPDKVKVFVDLFL